MDATYNLKDLKSTSVIVHLYPSEPPSLSTHIQYNILPQLAVAPMASKQQPRMVGKDASGVHVSLLNDDESSRQAPSQQTGPPRTLQRNNSHEDSPHQAPSQQTGPPRTLQRNNSYEDSHQAPSRQMSPTRTLQRINSLQSSDASSPAADSHLSTRQSSYSNESASPLTPMSAAFDGPNRSHQSSPFLAQRSSPTIPQPIFPQETALTRPYPPRNYTQPSYSPFSSANSSPTPRFSNPQYSYQTPNRPIVPWDQKGLDPNEPRRFPCRLADEYGCDKTFTTSGHASRHSKIHTAEKGVACTWSGCEKKFTRSDNMKQHLVTHKREKKKAPANGVKKRSSKSRQSSHDSSVAQNLSRKEVSSDFGPNLPVQPVMAQPSERVLAPEGRMVDTENTNTGMGALVVAADLHTRLQGPRRASSKSSSLDSQT